MILSDYYTLLRSNTSLSDSDAATMLQQAYDYTVDKLRLDVYALPVLINGACSVDSCWIYKDGARYSEVSIKHIVTMNETELGTEKIPALASLDIRVYESIDDVSAYFGNEISYSENILYASEESGAMLMAHVRPYLVAGVDPFAEQVQYAVSYLLTNYSDRHINSLLFLPVMLKFRSLAMMHDLQLGESTTFDSMFTQLINIYNRNIEAVKNAELTLSGTMIPNGLE